MKLKTAYKRAKYKVPFHHPPLHIAPSRFPLNHPLSFSLPLCHTHTTKTCHKIKFCHSFRCKKMFGTHFATYIAKANKTALNKVE